MLSAHSTYRMALVALLAATLALAAPARASAHGPVAPLASDYLARVVHVPSGLEAKVVDGDQRMWLRVPARLAVVVLDYRGAPYLRFSAMGVDVNQNSEMYYLNLTPVALTPPSDLTATTPPHWQHVSGAHSYGWHDGRLHALAIVALTPGSSYVGSWTIPVLLGGSERGAITGGLWHAGGPSIVWFWPILVVLLCVLAARRLRRPELDSRLARVLAIAALGAVALASGGRQLHGRPMVGAFSLVELAVILALVAWALSIVVRGRAGALTLFVVALAAIWEGISLLPALLDGFVLMAVPPFVARVAAVICLGGGLGLLLLAFRIFESSGPGRTGRRAAGAVGAAVVAVALGACGSAGGGSAGGSAGGSVGGSVGSAVGSGSVAAKDGALPAALVAEARPIGRGPRFQPPAQGSVLGICRRGGLGRRFGVHVELFAANRVVIVPAGIGTRGPRQRVEGRIAAARCYGDLVTIEPTGVVLIRLGGPSLRLAALFASWGQPLSAHRLASFTGGRVRVFVGGRRWPGSPGSVPLTPHAEIVLEIGPAVPPHASYTFPPGS